MNKIPIPCFRKSLHTLCLGKHIEIAADNFPTTFLFKMLQQHCRLSKTRREIKLLIVIQELTILPLPSGTMDIHDSHELTSSSLDINRKSETRLFIRLKKFHLVFYCMARMNESSNRKISFVPSVFFSQYKMIFGKSSAHYFFRIISKFLETSNIKCVSTFEEVLKRISHFSVPQIQEKNFHPLKS